MVNRMPVNCRRNLVSAKTAKLEFHDIGVLFNANRPLDLAAG